MSTAEKRSAEEAPEAVKKAKTAEDEEENIEEEEDDLDEEGEEGEEGEDEEDGEDEGVRINMFLYLFYICTSFQDWVRFHEFSSLEESGKQTE